MCDFQCEDNDIYDYKNLNIHITHVGEPGLSRDG